MDKEEILCFEALPPLSPSSLFALSWNCPFLKGSLRRSSSHQLPSTAALLDEQPFAVLYMGWKEEGITCIVDVDESPHQDESVVELFFDTRDLKNKIGVSRFSHHFAFTPYKVGDFFGRELSRFRSEDMHSLCDSADLEVSVDSRTNQYTMHLEIPAHCLHGYDPSTYNRMGFTYRIGRSKRGTQHFSVSSEEYPIEQYPSLWASLTLRDSK